MDVGVDEEDVVWSIHEPMCDWRKFGCIDCERSYNATAEGKCIQTLDTGRYIVCVAKPFHVPDETTTYTYCARCVKPLKFDFDLSTYIISNNFDTLHYAPLYYDTSVFEHKVQFDD